MSDTNVAIKLWKYSSTSKQVGINVPSSMSIPGVALYVNGVVNINSGGRYASLYFHSNLGSSSGYYGLVGLDVGDTEAAYGRIYFSEASVQSNSSAKAGGYEHYFLPIPNKDITEGNSISYSIITSKSLRIPSNSDWGQVWSLFSGQAIVANTDLNTLSTVGNYVCPATADAQTLSNCPWGTTTNNGSAFTLKVINGTGSTTTNDYKRQELYQYNRNYYWVRYSSNNGSSWSSWYMVGTVAAGSSTLPIYISSDGTPTAVSDINLSKDNVNNTEVSVSNTHGSVSILTSTNRGLYDKTNGKWIVKHAEVGDHTYIPLWSNVGSTSIPVYFNSSGEPTPITSAIPVTLGGTGATTAEGGANALLSGLPTWTATATDDTYFMRQDTAGSNAFGRVKFSTLWSYIKGKGDSTYKPIQTAKSDPTASGSGITYIASISQDANGVITATKSTVRSASDSQSGIVTTEAQTFDGQKTFAKNPLVGTGTEAVDRFIQVRSNSGSISLESAGVATGDSNRGIWLGPHGTATAGRWAIRADTNNNVFLGTHSVTGALTLNYGSQYTLLYFKPTTAVDDYTYGLFGLNVGNTTQPTQSRFYFQEESVSTADGATTGYKELYYLPASDNNRTEDESFYILTTKGKRQIPANGSITLTMSGSARALVISNGSNANQRGAYIIYQGGSVKAVASATAITTSYSGSTVTFTSTATTVTYLDVIIFNGSIA